MFKNPPRGFRLFWYDPLLLLGGGLAGGLAWSVEPALAALPWLVVGHFFLFCNVFRIRRSFELIWAAVFCALQPAWLLTDLIPAWMALSIPPALATLLIGLEIRSPRYHGVFSKVERQSEL